MKKINEMAYTFNIVQIPDLHKIQYSHHKNILNILGVYFIEFEFWTFEIKYELIQNVIS